MATPSNTLIDDFLKMLLQGTDPSWRANANLYLSLHTANPGAGGNQSTSEATYGSYARQVVAHSSGGFTIASHSGTNANAINFPVCTGGSETLTHIAIGTSASGAGTVLLSIALAASLAVSAPIQPIFPASSLTFTLA